MCSKLMIETFNNNKTLIFQLGFNCPKSAMEAPEKCVSTLDFEKINAGWNTLNSHKLRAARDFFQNNFKTFGVPFVLLNYRP